MDKIAVTVFLTGRGNTLPLEIWSRLRRSSGDERHCHPDLFVFGRHYLFVTLADDPRDEQPMSWTDKELGMDRPITRRDFMQGAAVAAAVTPRSSFGEEAQDLPGYNPPAAHGMRGSHLGAFEVAHSLRYGTFWKNAGPTENTGKATT
jgi:hypothetical protein